MPETALIFKVLARTDPSFRKTLDDLEKGIDRVGRAAREANVQLDQVGRGATERFRGLSNELEHVKNDHRELQGQVTELGKGFGVAAAAAGAGLALILANAVRISSEFEQLQGRLETVQGSSARAQKTLEAAKQLAARTPFDVRGIVEATVQLEVYGQRSQEVLPRVADLAAGMGRNLNETALVVGKALSGSLEGFESLRNTYGVSSQDLKKYGAVLTKTGSVATVAGEDLEKARQALLRLIQVRFGGAIDRQAKTLQGSLSNAADAVTNFAAKFGDDLAPAVQVGAQIFTKMVEVAGSVPDTFRQIATFGAVATAGLLVLGGGAVTATAGLAAMNQQLALAAVNGFPAAGRAAVVTGSALKGLGAVAGTVGGVMTILTTTIAGPLVAALAIANLATLNYARTQERLGQAIGEQARTIQDSRATLRSITSVVNDLAKEQGVFVERTNDASKFAEQFGKALDNIPAGRLAARLVALGYTLDELKKKLAENREAADERRRQIQALQEAIAKAPPITDSTIQVTDELKTLFPDSWYVSVDEANEALQLLQQEFSDLGQEATALRQAQQKVAAISPDLKALTEETARLKDYLNFAGATGSVDNLKGALSELDAQLARNNEKLKKAALPTSFEGLQRALLEGADQVTEQQRAVIQEQLGLLKTREQLQSSITDKTQQKAKEEVDAVERSLREQKSLREVSTSEEIAELERALAAAKRLGQAGLDDAIQIREKIKAVRAQEAKDAEETAKKLVEGQLKAATQAVTEVKNQQGATAAEVVDQIDLVLTSLQKWRDKNRQLLDDYPELSEQLKEFTDRLTGERGQQATKALADNFNQLKQQVADFSAGATNATQRLEANARAIALIKSAQRRGSIDTATADQELRGLARERLGLEQQITNERRAQADEVAALQIQAVQQEIDLLQTRLQAGEAVEDQLMAKRLELQKVRLEAIDRELQADLAAGKDRELAEQKARLKREAILREGTINRKRELAEQEKDQAAGVARQNAQTGLQTATASLQPPAGAPEGPTPTADPRLTPDQALTGGSTAPSLADLRAKATDDRARRADSFRRSNQLGLELVSQIDESRRTAAVERDTPRLQRAQELFRERLSDKLDRAGVVDSLRAAAAQTAPQVPTFEDIGQAQRKAATPKGSPLDSGGAPKSAPTTINQTFHTTFGPHVTVTPKIEELVNQVAQEIAKQVKRGSLRDGGAGRLGS
ncbi:MAG: hypothetical protein AB7S38_11200 [Vulcanimicrobiota bacterium]